MLIQAWGSAARRSGTRAARFRPPPAPGNWKLDASLAQIWTSSRYSRILAMRSLRRRLSVLLFAIPLWALAPSAAAAQTLTADINGDGVRDRIETRRAAGGARRPALQPGAGAAPQILRFHPRRRRHRRGRGRRFGPGRDDDGSTAPPVVRVDERRPRQVRLPTAEAARPDRVPSARPPAIDVAGPSVSRRRRCAATPSGCSC